MMPSDIFYNSADRLRSGWRFLIYVCLILLLSFIGEAIFLPVNYYARSLSNDFIRFTLELIFRLLLFSIAILAGWACGRFLEDLPLRALGFSPERGYARDLWLGSLIGAITLAIAVLLAFASGGLRFTFSAANMLPAAGKTIVVSAFIFLIAAAAEEVMFRGYPLQTMTRVGLAWVGILLTSVPFAAVHLSNPNSTIFAFINTILAGVWLAVAYLRTRNLWFPLGVHWAWNWTMAAIFGIPVSGITELTPHPLLRANDFGPVWLTGGAYGIEGGVACTIALVFSTIFVWRTKLLSASEEIKALTSHEIPKRREPPSAILRWQDEKPDNNQPPASEERLTADE
jgi:membrane protease YdiL (CAAX protease family)